MKQKDGIDSKKKTYKNIIPVVARTQKFILLSSQKNSFFYYLII